MDEEKIKELEYLFNYYSRRYSLYVHEREEHHVNMTALQTLQIAVKAFGYKFVVKGTTTDEYGTEYKIYELVKINKQRKYKK